MRPIAIGTTTTQWWASPLRSRSAERRCRSPAWSAAESRGRCDAHDRPGFALAPLTPIRATTTELRLRRLRIAAAENRREAALALGVDADIRRHAGTQRRL